MIDRHAIIVVTGAQAAGKTTVGRLLASRFARGAFVEADALQRMIVSGLAWVTDVNDAPVRPTGEAMAQLRLRLHNACLLTRSFYEAGFSAVLDDIIIGERFDHLREGLAGLPFHLVVLAPSVATIEARDAARDKTVGGGWADYLDSGLRATMSGVGLWLDTSHLTPDEAVDEIILRVWDEGLIKS
jgi:chloramphenicol 3-O-phosphotransferase